MLSPSSVQRASSQWNVLSQRRTHERRDPKRWRSCLAECAGTSYEWDSDLCPPSSLTRSRGALPPVVALIRSRSIMPLSYIISTTGTMVAPFPQTSPRHGEICARLLIRLFVRAMLRASPGNISISTSHGVVNAHTDNIESQRGSIKAGDTTRHVRAAVRRRITRADALVAPAWCYLRLVGHATCLSRLPSFVRRPSPRAVSFLQR